MDVAVVAGVAVLPCEPDVADGEAEEGVVCRSDADRPIGVGPTEQGVLIPLGDVDLQGHTHEARRTYGGIGESPALRSLSGSVSCIMDHTASAQIDCLSEQGLCCTSDRWREGLR